MTFLLLYLLKIILVREFSLFKAPVPVCYIFKALGGIRPSEIYGSTNKLEFRSWLMRFLSFQMSSAKA